MTELTEKTASVDSVELTKKQELNNHVVLMRKVIRQARVHVIRKLTREIKLLRKRKGPEKIQSKAKRKADRLHEEILSIRKLSKDTVSIFALQNKKCLLDVLRKEKSSMKDRSTARLADYSLVQAEVKAYREKNPHWELQIPVLLEKSKEKLKKLKKKQESQAEETVIPIVDADGNDSETESIKNNKADKKPTPKKVKVEEIKQVKVNVKKKSEKEKNKQPENKKQPTKIEKSEGTLRVQILTDLNELENDTHTVKVVEESKPKNESADIIPKKKPKSAFFVGGEDEYRPEKEVQRPAAHFQNTDRDRHQHGSAPQPKFRKGKLLPAKPEGFKYNNQDSSNYRAGRAPRYFEGNSNSTAVSAPKPRFGNSEDFRRPTPAPFKGRPEDTKSAAGHLHPSWEAKKRQASTITSFQGKKITFDD